MPSLSDYAAAVQAANAELEAAQSALDAAPATDIDTFATAIIAGDAEPDSTIQAARERLERAQTQAAAAQRVFGQANRGEI